MTTKRCDLEFIKPVVARDECGEVRHAFEPGDTVEGAIRLSNCFELTKYPCDGNLVYFDQVRVLLEYDLNGSAPRQCPSP